MLMIQPDFFLDNREVLFNTIIASICDLKHSSDKVRKGTYASINEIKKKQLELDERLAILEHNLCKKGLDTMPT